MDLIFQVPMQDCFLQHQTLLSPPDTSTTEHRFCFGSAPSFFLELLVIALCTSPVTCWTPSDLGRVYHLPVSYLFAFSYCSWDSPHKNTGVGFHFLLQCTMFCWNSSLWPTRHGWPWMPWLIALLSYTCPFATTWSCAPWSGDAPVYWFQSGSV